MKVKFKYCDLVLSLVNFIYFPLFLLIISISYKGNGFIN